MRSPSEVARFPLVGVALAIALVSCESDTTQPVEQPAITLSVATAELAAVAAGVDPAPLTLSVLNSGGGELTGLEAAVTYAAGQPTGWLTAALSGTTAPGTLTLTAVVGAIGAGTHEATVAVTAAGASNSPQTVAVTFVVDEQPAITLSAASAEFDAVSGGSDPEPVTIGIENGGGGELAALEAAVTYAAGHPTGWLTAGLSGPTAPGTLTLTAAVGSLPAGTHEATVAVTSEGASNTPQTVTATFTVIRDPDSYLGFFEFTPVVVIQCDMGVYGTLMATIRGLQITTASMDSLGTLTVVEIEGAVDGINSEMSVALDPLLQAFSGSVVTNFDQTLAFIYRFSGQLHHGLEGTFTSDDTAAVHVTATLDPTMEGPEGIVEGTCTEESVDVIATRT